MSKKYSKNVLPYRFYGILQDLFFKFDVAATFRMKIIKVKAQRVHKKFNKNIKRKLI